jgi:catechol 2,3-dioxygenase-like lactoylglutathione lyase family enzyme
VIVGLHHVGLRANDVAASLRFHRAAGSFDDWPAAQTLGVMPGAQWLRSSNVGLCVMPISGAQQPQRRPVSEAGITHVCLQTPNIGVVRDAFAAAGANFHCPPIDLGTGFLYTYARDLEHNVVEIECVPPVWREVQPWVAHVNIASAELDRLVDFYAAFLQTTPVKSPRLHSDPRLDAIADLRDVSLRARWLALPNAQIELMQYQHPATTAHTGRRDPNAPGFAHIAFEVDDLHAAVRHLRQCGGQADEPAPAAFMGTGTDPDGNTLLLLELSAPAQRGASVMSLREPRITQRFAAAREALLKTP